MMKNIFTAIMAFMLVCAASSHAFTLDIIPAQTHVTTGNLFTVGVEVNGLQDTAAPSLGDYDLNVNYDASLLSVSAIQWGDSLKGDQLDLSGNGSLKGSWASTGTLNLWEISLDSALDLESLQAGSFTLFRIVFSAIAPGKADVALDINALGNAFGEALRPDAVNTTSVDIDGVTKVPEPSAFLLLIGGFAIVLLRKKLHQQ